MNALGLPRLREAVELTELAARVYRYLEPQEYVGRLAPSLGMILQRDLGIAEIEVSSEFLDTITFLSTTHFREPIVDALRSINTSLQRVSDAVPVLPLTHAMGLGKTHLLTLLYHLYTKAPQQWTDIQSYLPDEAKTLTQKTNYRTDVAEKTLVIALDLKHIPGNMLPYSALFNIMHKIFTKYKKSFLIQRVPQSKLAEFESLLAGLSMYEPKEAARELVNKLSELAITTPILIIVDEVYAGVFEAIMGASKEYIDSIRRTIMFLNLLVDELRGRVPAILVYASAMQDVQRWRSIARQHLDSPEKELLKTTIEYFEERTGRVTLPSVRDVNEEEALEIVKKRVVRLREPIANVLSESALKELSKVISDIVGEEEAKLFTSELRKTYPFSPVFRELVRKLIVPAYSADFNPGRLQHLRDLIKISSSVLGRVIESRDESYLVSIAHIEYDDIKHLLDEDHALEWRKNILSWNRFLELLEAETRDQDVVEMIKGAISSIYLKSVTNNAWDLILMMTKSPEVLTLEDLDRRALPQRKLLLSLIGYVDFSKLKKYPEVLEKLKVAPYIHDVTRPEDTYYYASLFENPYQLLSDIRESEIRKLIDPNGKLKIEEAIEYVRSSLEEYALVSEFKQRVSPRMEFVGVKSFETDEFIDHLNLGRGEFIILIVPPLDIAYKQLVEKRGFKEVLESIKTSIDRGRSKIRYLNMFAVVVPSIDEETLRKIAESLAEIRSSERIVNMIKSDVGMNKLAEETVERRKTLLELVRRPEEEFRRIVMEIIARFREKIENYAQQLTLIAVQNFTSDFISLFKTLITYNPSTGKIEILELNVTSQEQPSTLKGVIASLPVWLANAVKGRIQVVGEQDIRARLTEWLKKQVTTNNDVREKLRKDQKVEFSVSTIIDGLARGWPEIPIKPISVKSIRNALSLLNGITIQTDDRDFKLIEVEVGEEVLIIKPKAVLPPLPPRPISIIGFKVSGVDSTVITLSSVQRDKESMNHIESITVEVSGSNSRVHVSGPPDKIAELLQSLVRYLNRYRNEVSSCELEVLLRKAVEKPEAEELIRRMGLDSRKVSLLEKRIESNV